MTQPVPSHPAYPVPRRAESPADAAMPAGTPSASPSTDDPRAQLYLAFRDGRPFIAAHPISVGRVLDPDVPPAADRAQLSLFGR